MFKNVPAAALLVLFIGSACALGLSATADATVKFIAGVRDCRENPVIRNLPTSLYAEVARAGQVGSKLVPVGSHSEVHTLGQVGAVQEIIFRDAALQAPFEKNPRGGGQGIARCTLFVVAERAVNSQGVEVIYALRVFKYPADGRFFASFAHSGWLRADQLKRWWPSD